MKKRILSTLFYLFCAVHSPGALAQAAMPDEIFVSEHWLSLTKSYDIETQTHKLGTLYRRYYSWLLTYDFYDPNNVNTLIAEARFASIGAHLDLYEPTGNPIGSVEERIYILFPTFVIYGADLSTKLAYAEMNFWATKFHIYDQITHEEMAVMSRSYFRVKNDWTIKITNPSLFAQKNIDPRVFMTVLAIQGEIDDWKEEKNSMARKANLLSHVPEELKLIAEEHLEINPSLNKEQLEDLANELDQGFNTANPITTKQSDKQRINSFNAYCDHLLHSPDVSPEKKNGIKTLLKLRLQNHK